MLDIDLQHKFEENNVEKKIIRELVFDTETTGLTDTLWTENEKIIDVAFVEIINGKITGNSLQFYFNPQKPLKDKIKEITGLDNKDLEDKPLFEEKVDEILEYIGDSKLIAHNADFDIKFMNAELKRCGKSPLKNVVIDTLDIAKSKFGSRGNKLDDLCIKFNIDLSKRTKHGALVDTELLAEVYLKIRGGEQYDMLKSIEVKTISLEELKTLIKNKPLIPSRKFNLTDNEIKLHKDFIDSKVKGNIW